MTFEERTERLEKLLEILQKAIAEDERKRPKNDNKN